MNWSLSEKQGNALRTAIFIICPRGLRDMSPGKVEENLEISDQPGMEQPFPVPVPMMEQEFQIFSCYSFHRKNGLALA